MISHKYPIYDYELLGVIGLVVRATCFLRIASQVGLEGPETTCPAYQHKLVKRALNGG